VLTSRRFQSHAAFASLCFDITRRSHNNSKVHVQSTWNTWPQTTALLEKPTSEELLEAAEQARQYRPITNPAVKELLKAITRVGSTSAGSNEKKSHMLAELKSSVVYHGCPIIFITLNPIYIIPSFNPCVTHKSGGAGGGNCVWLICSPIYMVIQPHCVSLKVRVREQNIIWAPKGVVYVDKF
jgi:Helitron helicase-like domain at N-terminus